MVESGEGKEGGPWLLVRGLHKGSHRRQKKKAQCLKK